MGLLPTGPQLPGQLLMIPEQRPHIAPRGMARSFRAARLRLFSLVCRHVLDTIGLVMVCRCGGDRALVQTGHRLRRHHGDGLPGADLIAIELARHLDGTGNENGDPRRSHDDAALRAILIAVGSHSAAGSHFAAGIHSLIAQDIVESTFSVGRFARLLADGTLLGPVGCGKLLNLSHGPAHGPLEPCCLSLRAHHPQESTQMRLADRAFAPGGPEERIAIEGLKPP